jgi:hypothetical protein
VVTAKLRRVGEPAPPASLQLFDPVDGTALATLDLAVAEPVCEVNLSASAEQLVVEWRTRKDVLAWGR